MTCLIFRSQEEARQDAYIYAAPKSFNRLFFLFILVLLLPVLAAILLRRACIDYNRIILSDKKGKKKAEERADDIAVGDATSQPPTTNVPTPTLDAIVDPPATSDINVFTDPPVMSGAQASSQAMLPGFRGWCRDMLIEGPRISELVWQEWHPVDGSPFRPPQPIDGVVFGVGAYFIELCVNRFEGSNRTLRRAVGSLRWVKPATSGMFSFFGTMWVTERTLTKTCSNFLLPSNPGLTRPCRCRGL